MVIPAVRANAALKVAQAVKIGLRRIFSRIGFTAIGNGAPHLNEGSRKSLSSEDNSFRGIYETWVDAMRLADGYTKPDILSKVRISILKVKAGNAAYERDSVLFSKKEYNWPLLAVLLRISTRSKGSLRVTDFGGSLGSTFFQCRDFLSDLVELSWRVVEQDHFVRCGRDEVAGGALQFDFSIEESLLAHQKADTLLLSGVLQYLQDPYDWVCRLSRFNFESIVLDRTAFIASEHERLTLQHVPPAIYHAVYPAWFFCEDRLLAAFKRHGYSVRLKFDSTVDPGGRLEDGAMVYWCGFWLTRAVNRSDL